MSPIRVAEPPPPPPPPAAPQWWLDLYPLLTAYVRKLVLNSLTRAGRDVTGWPTT